MVNKSRGEMAYTLVDVDSPVEQKVVDAVNREKYRVVNAGEWMASLNRGDSAAATALAVAPNKPVALASKRRGKSIDTAAKASDPAPHPSVVEAEATVTRAPPKTGVEEAQRLAKDMGLDDPPELADIAVMKRDNLLTAADEASLERAAETVKEANGWAEAYKTLATCSLRFGE